MLFYCFPRTEQVFTSPWLEPTGKKSISLASISLLDFFLDSSIFYFLFSCTPIFFSPFSFSKSIPLCHLYPKLQVPPPHSFSLCLERKRWPLNVSSWVWGSGEQPTHCVTPPWTPDGLMNEGNPHLLLHPHPHSQPHLPSCQTPGR